MQSKSDSLRVVHITDPHLKQEPDGDLLGMNTRSSLAAVLDLVRANHPAPDLILATGDIAQDGSEEAYLTFAKSLSPFPCPSFWFPGNHDDRPAMRAVATANLQRHYVGQHWQIVLLDSLVPGKVYGELAPSELDHLEACLETYPELHTLVTLHHHPVAVGSRWIDRIGLRGAERFWEVISRHENARAVLWGHIHQEFDRLQGDVRLMATPSTCVQFLPQSEKFAIDRRSPGYRWLELRADGGIDTGVVRADHIEFEVDYDSRGY